MRDIGRASLLKKGIHQLKTYSGTTAEYRSGVVIFKLSISERDSQLMFVAAPE